MANEIGKGKTEAVKAKAGKKTGDDPATGLEEEVSGQDIEFAKEKKILENVQMQNELHRKPV